MNRILAAMRTIEVLANLSGISFVWGFGYHDTETGQLNAVGHVIGKAATVLAIGQGLEATCEQHKAKEDATAMPAQSLVRDIESIKPFGEGEL